METTRRSFLGGLAISSALSGTAVCATAKTPAENPELLRLGKEFDAIHARFLAAADRLPPLQTAYRQISPDGAGILFNEHDRGRYHFLLEFFQDPTDPKFGIMKTATGHRVMRVCPYSIEHQIKIGVINPVHFTQILALAQKFEADIEDAKAKSGLGDALDAYWILEARLRSIVYDISAVRARTAAGVAIKVRATGAYAALGKDERLNASLWLARAIWEDLGEDA